MHQWYQILLASYMKEFENAGFVLSGNAGFHVDEIPDNALHREINERCKMGRNLSVQKKVDEKPLLAFGHDECIF